MFGSRFTKLGAGLPLGNTLISTSNNAISKQQNYCFLEPVLHYIEYYDCLKKFSLQTELMLWRRQSGFPMCELDWRRKFEKKRTVLKKGNKLNKKN